MCIWSHHNCLAVNVPATSLGENHLLIMLRSFSERLSMLMIFFVPPFNGQNKPIIFPSGIDI